MGMGISAASVISSPSGDGVSIAGGLACQPLPRGGGSIWAYSYSESKGPLVRRLAKGATWHQRALPGNDVFELSPRLYEACRLCLLAVRPSVSGGEVSISVRGVGMLDIAKFWKASEAQP